VNHDDPRSALSALVNGAKQTQCVRAAVELGLAGHLAAGPATSAELAAACGAHEPALRRLLRALVAMDVLTMDGGQAYSLTPVGNELRSDRIAAQAVNFGSDPHWAAWTGLVHAIRTGEIGFDHVYGMRNYDYYADHPAAAALFHKSIATNTSRVTGGVVESYDFSGFATVVDVGGGDGTLLAGILRHFPGIRGILVDLPHAVEKARPTLEAAGVAERWELRPGDFRDAVPPGDVYLLKSILHNWADAEAVTILRRCRQAGGPSAHLIVIERVLPEHPSGGALDPLLMDLTMMIMNGGRERTLEEYRHLIALAGFRLDRTMPTGTEFSVIEAAATA
jgi:hypothetical protein